MDPEPPRPPAPTPAPSIQEISDQVKEAGAWVAPVREEMARVLVGQKALVDRLLVGLVTNGHILLEGVPGLAKTLALRALAATVRARFQRLQFTPDMLPADIVGTLIYQPASGTFATKPGPIFANLVLADEINRAPAKVQSALLEAMQERQVTLGDATLPLPDPFLVLATQNPVEQEGTYPLPEAQCDRFLLKVIVGYPTRAEERRILETRAGTSPSFDLRPIIGAEEVRRARAAVDRVYMDDKIKDYILDLVTSTRAARAHGLELAPYLRYGASPRATLALALAARAHAFLLGRGYVTPQDVKALAPDVLRHRLILSYEAEAENIDADSLIQRLLDAVPVP